jgi:hypothetical protein
MDVISYWFGKVPQNAYEAAGLGDYRMTKKLEPNLKDQEYKELILFAAIHGGSVKVFEFLYMKGYPLKFKKENHVCLHAVEQLVISNNIKLLKYLIDQCVCFIIINHMVNDNKTMTHTKFLVLGSAPYMKDWVTKHLKWFIENNYKIVCFNNSWKLVEPIYTRFFYVT